MTRGTWESRVRFERVQILEDSTGRANSSRRRAFLDTLFLSAGEVHVHDDGLRDRYVCEPNIGVRVLQVRAEVVPRIPSVLEDVIHSLGGLDGECSEFLEETRPSFEVTYTKEDLRCFFDFDGRYEF